MSVRISIKQFRKDEGLESTAEFQGFLRDCISDGYAPALCEDGCDVEPDGECEHGHPSILMALELI